MNYTMLVTTFAGDIKQFYMFCYCLAKNWQGKRELIVCIGNGDKEETFKKITDEIFDSSWKISVKPTIHPYQMGVTEQQVNTVYYSTTSGCEDVIVWDCKDFLLRPCGFETFKKDNKYRLTFTLFDKKITEMGYDLSELIDAPHDHFPAILNLRPWIWNVEELQRYWDTMISKFGHFTTWPAYPTACEIYGYYVFMLTDPQRTIKLEDPKDSPLLLGGGWTHQTYDGILQEAIDFDRWPERLVWKHSRKLEDPRCLDVTKSVLLKYNIDQEIVHRVFGN